MKMKRVLWLLLFTLSCSYYGTCTTTLEDILSFEDPSQRCFNVTNQGAFKELNLNPPVMFYGTEYKSLFVNSKGTISFVTQFTGLFRNQFRSSLGVIPTKSNSIFLAVLWNDPFDGEACYYQTSSETIIHRFVDHFLDTSEDQTSLTDFRPRSVIVATWKNVVIYNQPPDPTKTATFQAILATDGRITLSQFQYYSIHNETEYLIGFNAGDRMRGLELVNQTGPLTSEQKELVDVPYRIDGNCITPLTSSCPASSFSISCTPLPNITAVCNCSEGYDNANDLDNICEDIDECNLEQDNCSDSETCVNTAGSFVCCPLGFNRVDQRTGMCSVATTEGERQGSTGGPGNGGGSNDAGLIAGLVIGFFLIILIGVILVVVVLLTRRKNRWLLKYGVESHDYVEDDNNMEEIRRPSLHYAGSMIQLVKLPKELKIPFEDLEFEAKMIGEGEFGTVYRAKYNKEVVAVKILKGISGTYEIRQVVEEIMRMKQFSHANILSLTGVAIDNHFSPCIVMPFMWNGSLDAFLQKDENRDKFLFPTDGSTSGYEVEKATGKLLEMCHQIAQGMAYLTSVKIVHRDLAARNCMVALNNVIKVADFGLSVTMGEDKDYFRIADSGNEKLPVKWMAVESLIDYKFSEATDVWSYGITCWEIFNGGKKPYPTIRNKDVLREVLGGYRMDKPPNKACTDSIYAVMRSCWEREPTERPNFINLVSQTSTLLYEIKDYLPLVDSNQNIGCSNGISGAISPPANDEPLKFETKVDFEKEAKL